MGGLLTREAAVYCLLRKINNGLKDLVREDGKGVGKREGVVMADHFLYSHLHGIELAECRKIREGVLLPGVKVLAQVLLEAEGG